MQVKMKPETIARRAAERREATAAAAADRRARLIKAYDRETDREYAEEMWGTMLDESFPGWRTR